MYDFQILIGVHSNQPKAKVHVRNGEAGNLDQFPIDPYDAVVIESNTDVYETYQVPINHEAGIVVRFPGGEDYDMYLVARGPEAFPLSQCWLIGINGGNRIAILENEIRLLTKFTITTEEDDLILEPAGHIRYGEYHTIGSEVVVGYVLFKTADGNIRKLAIVG